MKKSKVNFENANYQEKYQNNIKIVGMTINESSSGSNFKMINISLNQDFHNKLDNKNRSILKELYNENVLSARSSLNKIQISEELFGSKSNRSINIDDNSQNQNKCLEEKSIVLSPFTNSSSRAEELRLSNASETIKEDKENISIIKPSFIPKISKISKKLDRVITSKYILRK